MAINKEDIKELSLEELKEKIQEEELRYKKMKFNHAVSQLDNPMTLRAVRRDIARLKTDLTRRKNEGEAKA